MTPVRALHLPPRPPLRPPKNASEHLQAVLLEEDDWPVGSVIKLFKTVLQSGENTALVANQFEQWLGKYTFTYGLMNPLFAQDLQKVQEIVARLRGN